MLYTENEANFGFGNTRSGEFDDDLKDDDFDYYMREGCGKTLRVFNLFISNSQRDLIECARMFKEHLRQLVVFH